MTLSLRTRLLIVALIAVPGGLWLWTYLSTRDWQHLARQVQLHHRLTLPPPPKHPSPHAPVGVVEHVVSDVLAIARSGLLIVAALVALIAISRLRHRRRRRRAMTTWELRLGRDDLTSPYHVQEAFEGIAGAISPRWYQRLVKGADHIALEIHRVEDASIRFAIAAPDYLGPAIKGPLEDLYPDVELIAADGYPDCADSVVRLKKQRLFVLSIQTIRNYDHAFTETLVALIGTAPGELTVQLVLTPAPGLLYRQARRLLKRRERRLQHADKRDPAELGIDSVIEAKELKGALELQHRSLMFFDLRVAGHDAPSVQRVAGVFSQLRSENELRRRHMRLRRGLYEQRIARAMPNPLPGIRTGVLSTSELATLWQLPRARAKHPLIPRASVRRASAPPHIDRDPTRALLIDEHGPVALAPADRKYGHAVIGGQGGGKSSVLARHFAHDTRDPDRAVILIDPKGPLAQLALGLVNEGRTVHYMDLGHPEIGFNPLTIKTSPGARAAVFVQALIEANPPGSIQAASDSFLRQAVAAVCAVERDPTLWHVYRMLDLSEPRYRSNVVARLQLIDGQDFARNYWTRDFRALITDRGYAAQALNPPRNKLERLISTSDIDTLLRHPHRLDIEGILQRGEVLIIAGAKATVGEDNTILVTQLLLQLLHRAIQAQHDLPEPQRRPVSLLIDEAHNVLTPSVAKMLAEGRSAGLEAVFAWQYTAQIRDELIRSGVRSLLQSISIFRMRELEDARSLAGLAMEVYSDRITVDQEEQERLRFSPDDILRLPIHRAINLWIADGIPRGAFVAHTLPMEDLHDPARAEHHLEAQRDRGAHHPGPLRDPLPRHSDPPTGAPVNASGAQPETNTQTPKPHRRTRGAADVVGGVQEQFPIAD